MTSSPNAPTRISPTHTIAIYNHKGGVGKTTLTANLGAGLAARGSRVLLVDVDAQGSLTVSFFTQDEWLHELLPQRTVKHWYDGLAEPDGAELLSAMVSTPPRVRGLLSHTDGCLDLVAAHRDLAEVDTALARLAVNDVRWRFVLDVGA